MVSSSFQSRHPSPGVSTLPSSKREPEEDSTLTYIKARYPDRTIQIRIRLNFEGDSIIIVPTFTNPFKRSALQVKQMSSDDPKYQKFLKA